MPTTALKASGKLEEVSPEQVSLSAQLGELIDFRRGELKRIQQEVLLEQAGKASAKREAEQVIMEARNEARKIVVEAQERQTANEKILLEAQKRLEFQKLELEARAKAVEELEATAEP